MVEPEYPIEHSPATVSKMLDEFRAELSGFNLALAISARSGEVWRLGRRLDEMVEKVEKLRKLTDQGLRAVYRLKQKVKKRRRTVKKHVRVKKRKRS